MKRILVLLACLSLTVLLLMAQSDQPPTGDEAIRRDIERRQIYGSATRLPIFRPGDAGGRDAYLSPYDRQTPLERLVYPLNPDQPEDSTLSVLLDRQRQQYWTQVLDAHGAPRTFNGPFPLPGPGEVTSFAVVREAVEEEVGRLAGDDETAWTEATSNLLDTINALTDQLKSLHRESPAEEVRLRAQFILDRLGEYAALERDNAVVNQQTAQAAAQQLNAAVHFADTNPHRYEEIRRQFLAVERTYPGTPWASRARHHLRELQEQRDEAAQAAHLEFKRRYEDCLISEDLAGALAVCDEFLQQYGDTTQAAAWAAQRELVTNRLRQRRGEATPAPTAP